MRISACIIAKNEENNINRCLESMKTIADEMIVVDTGSTDQTVEVAKSCGAKVYSYDWKNDFAKAKNYAIEQAKGDWIIFLDADEYFSDDTIPNVRLYIEKLHLNKKCHAICVKIINIDVDNDNIELSSFVNLRMFRNEPNFRYRYELHEELYNSKGQLEIFILSDVIEVYHTGYSYHIIEKKLKRNLSIIKEEIKKNGEIPRYYRYLCDCYHGLQQYDEAVKFGKLHIKSNVSSIANESTVYMKVIDSLIRSNAKIEEIKYEIENAIQVFPNIPDFYAQYGRYLCEQKEYEKSMQYFLKALEVNKKRDKYEADSFHGKLANLYCTLGELFFKKNQYNEAIQYYCRSLVVYKYNASALQRLYFLICRYNSIEIISILNRIYTRTKRDIKFIVDNLQRYRLNKVFVYYSNILKQEFFIESEFMYQNQMIGLKKYAKLYEKSSEEMADKILLLAVVSIANNDIKMIDKEILPNHYKNIVSRFYNDDIILTDDDFNIYEELTYNLISINAECLDKYLLILSDFSLKYNLKIAQILIDYRYYRKAIDIYQKNLSKYDIDNVLSYEKIGYCYYKLNIYEKAVRFFNQAIEYGSNNKELIQLNSWSKENLKNEIKNNKKITGTKKNQSIVDDKDELKAYQYFVKSAIKENRKNSENFLVASHDREIKNNQNLQFILRRIENDINPVENLKIIVKKICEQQNDISQIVQAIETGIYQKSKVVILLSMELYQYNMINETLKLLVKFYKIYPMDVELVYTLAYILNLVQDKDSALNVLTSFKGKKDKNIKALIQEIRGKK